MLQSSQQDRTRRAELKKLSEQICYQQIHAREKKKAFVSGQRRHKLPFPRAKAVRSWDQVFDRSRLDTWIFEQFSNRTGGRSALLPEMNALQRSKMRFE